MPRARRPQAVRRPLFNIIKSQVSSGLRIACMVRFAKDGGPPEFGGRPPRGLRRASESRLWYVGGGPPAFGGRPPKDLRRACASRLWYVLPRIAGLRHSEAGLRGASVGPPNRVYGTICERRRATGIRRPASAGLLTGAACARMVRFARDGGPPAFRGRPPSGLRIAFMVRFVRDGRASGIRRPASDGASVGPPNCVYGTLCQGWRAPGIRRPASVGPLDQGLVRPHAVLENKKVTFVGATVGPQ